MISHGSTVTNVHAYVTTQAKGLVDELNKVLFVSTTGNDNNTGKNKSNALATVTKAIEKGASKILICKGVYNETIDLKEASGNITIMPEKNGDEVIFDGFVLLTNAVTLVSGKVYVFDSVSLISTNAWLYQKGVNDPTTLISDSERNALERGLEYRCEDTVVKRCSADNYSDAIAEIQSSEQCLWWQDTSNNKVYLSTPEEVSANHPIIYSGASSYLFKNTHIDVSLYVVGIIAKHKCFNVNKMCKVELVDCAAKYVSNNGAFVYDNTLDVRFVRCEAARCKSSNGDGFNGHSSTEGDTFAKTTTCALIDCWAHDNYDDGYSDHERSETTIIGGLYEYNGKAGVTSSYGSHCTGYNIISRKNGNGFFYTGVVTQSEGGKYGQATFNGCVAESNREDGFRLSGTGNTMLLIGCVSMNNRYGYVPEGSTNITCIDCKAINNTQDVYNSPHVTIITPHNIE